MYGLWYEFWYWPRNVYQWVRGTYYGLRPKKRTKEDLGRARQNGLVLDQMAFVKAKREAECNHLKGGYISRKGEWPLQGDQKNQYSVIKHQLSNGDWWVRCTRCGHTWTAPVRRNYRSEADFYLAVQDYVAATKFETRNQPSTSIQFLFSDGGETYRRLIQR